MDTLYAIFLVGAAAVLSTAFTWALVNFKTFLTPDCEVTPRSLHQQAVPRGGGLAIIAAWLICGFAAWRLGLLPENVAAPWGLAMVLLGVVSYIDDHRHVPSLVRLLAHTLAVGVVVFWFQFPIHGVLPGLHLEAGTPAVLFALIFGVWMVNRYNFMDGMDGSAGGMAIFGFGALAIMGWIQGHEGFMIANLLVVACVLGFLVFNFPPAKIFLGDIGSTALGLLAAAYSLWASGNELIPLWISALAFSPFIVDATVTLLMRAARGEKVWEAHREHLFQRLICLYPDRSHARALKVAYILMFGSGLSAILALNGSVGAQWLILVLWALIYGALIWAVGNLRGIGIAPGNIDKGMANSAH